MIAAQRYERIRQILGEQGTATIHELVNRIGVSRETVRRDIQYLLQSGELQKVHGGVTSLHVGVEKNYAARATSNAEAKGRIGAAAARLISAGDTVFVDSGTTCLELARALPMGMRIQAFTNSLVIAGELADRQITAYMLGGLVRPGDLSVSGAMAQSAARGIYVDRAFFGAGGISAETGFMDYHMEEVALRKSLAERAGEVIILADSSKFGTRALAQAFAWSDVTLWITDGGLDATHRSLVPDAETKIQSV